MPHSNSRNANQICILIGNLVKHLLDKTVSPRRFVRGMWPMQVSKKMIDTHEPKHSVVVSPDSWLTTERFAEKFDESFTAVLGAKHELLCNYESSANPLALTAFNSSRPKDRAPKPGDEVIPTAAGFPATVNLKIQNQLVPLLVDARIKAFNVLSAELVSRELGAMNLISMSEAINESVAG